MDREILFGGKFGDEWKYGYVFSGLQIRKCPYSERGLHVCVYCCKSCPYVKQVKHGCICTYQRD